MLEDFHYGRESACVVFFPNNSTTTNYLGEIRSQLYRDLATEKDESKEGAKIFTVGEPPRTLSTCSSSDQVSSPLIVSPLSWNLTFFF